MVRAGKAWIPKRLAEEIDSISKAQDLPRPEAMRKVADYSRIGREVENIQKGFLLDVWDKKKKKRRW